MLTHVFNGRLSVDVGALRLVFMHVIAMGQDACPNLVAAAQACGVPAFRFVLTPRVRVQPRPCPLLVVGVVHSALDCGGFSADRVDRPHPRQDCCGPCPGHHAEKRPHLQLRRAVGRCGPSVTAAYVWMAFACVLSGLVVSRCSSVLAQGQGHRVHPGPLDHSRSLQL